MIRSRNYFLYINLLGLFSLRAFSIGNCSRLFAEIDLQTRQYQIQMGIGGF